MVIDVQELALQARQALAGQETPPQEQAPAPFVTKEDVVVAGVEAEKAIVAAQQTAALTGSDQYVEAFKEPTSLNEIVLEKLKSITENEYTVKKLYEANLPSIEAMNRVLLTKESREMYANAYITGIQTQKSEVAYQAQVNQVTREALLKRHEVVETAKEFNDHVTKTLGSTGLEVLEALPADEYVNRILSYKAEQKKLFDEWKSGKAAPTQSHIVANQDYVKSSKQIQVIDKLTQALSSKY